MILSKPEPIYENNLSHAWAKAFLHAYYHKGNSPIVVSVNKFEDNLPVEDPEIRKELDACLEKTDKNPSRVSAMMIFPFDLWKALEYPPIEQFSKICKEVHFPKINKWDSRNNKGTYFERMINFKGSIKKDGKLSLKSKNQLEHILNIWEKGKETGKRPRQSALQISCFDPVKDHTGSSRLGFPCLQQVSLCYDDEGGLGLNAFYPTQYIFDRGYGNYLGLCHLGKFMAEQMGLKLVRLNSFVGKVELGSVKKEDLAGLISVINKSIK